MFFGGERYSLLIVSKSEKFDASLRAMLPEVILIDMLDIRLRHAHRVNRRLRQTPKILGCCPVHRRPLL